MKKKKIRPGERDFHRTKIKTRPGDRIVEILRLLTENRSDVRGKKRDRQEEGKKKRKSRGDGGRQ